VKILAPGGRTGPAILAVGAFLGLCSVSCDRGVVRGAVVDFRGAALPGVPITVDGQDANVITNARGEYKTAVAGPGAVELRFVKTGYTAGRLALPASGPGVVNARPVMLWRLPQSAGVYLLEDYQYRPCAPAAPRPFSTEARSLVYAAAKLPELTVTAIAEPLIVFHKLPAHDVRLSRLSAAQAAPLDAPASLQEVWTADGVLPIQMVPVDEPERALWRMNLLDTLSPGVYGVHWGALDGYTSTDPRVFLFRVAGAPAETEPDEAAPQAPDDPEVNEETVPAPS